MPPNTGKSKVTGVENQSMVLRKQRQSGVLHPSSQRKAFNEIGNVVQHYDARTSICVDILKESKASPLPRKSVAAVTTIRRKMSVKTSEPGAAEGKVLRRSTRVHIASLMPPNVKPTTETAKNRPTESIDRLLPPPMGPPPQVGHVKRKSSSLVTFKRAPRLTLKPPATPPETLAADAKKRQSTSCHPLRRLTLKPTVTIQPNSTSIPALPESNPPSSKPSLKVRGRNKPLGISAKYDIDLMHHGCLWMVSGYAKRIYSYLQKLEFKLDIRSSLINAPLVAEETRATMVEWLAYNYHQLRLLQETYLLSISLLDRYLIGTKSIEKDKLQLIALICLCLGIKFEEAIPGSIKEMLKLTKDAYTKEQFLKMEADVIQVLDFQICRPVSITFLRRYNLAARCDRVQHTYGKYLIDLAQLDKALAHERPSCLAAAAVFVGICITKSEVNSQHWNPVLCHYTSYNFQDIQPTVSRIASIAITGGGNCNSVRRKYSSETNYRVADKLELQLSLLEKLV
ncbi:hypothetical protein GE061_015664 [Apolygus lucorum]|uniref:Cyclin N-terminal domain-containing protein n=1 Tax=Apolygus lucorum TaxID=248454 RepID=A0A8S9XLL8_APOLU|nr:hypothetical protein GE061_015664 [Apolygus lucorum]